MYADQFEEENYFAGVRAEIIKRRRRRRLVRRVLVGALVIAASWLIVDIAKADTLTALQAPAAPAGIGPVTSVRMQPQKFVDDAIVGQVVFVGPKAIGRYVQSGYHVFAALWRPDGSVVLGAEVCYQPPYLGIPKICAQPNYVGGTAVIVDGTTWMHIDAVSTAGSELLNSVFIGWLWQP